MLLGVDPGLTGALAVLAPDGVLVALHDTPTLPLATSRGTKQEYDIPAWWNSSATGMPYARACAGMALPVHSRFLAQAPQPP